MLKLKNICKYYKIGKTKNIILDNITIDFKKHELVFILGPSGSGKTTLLNIIGGMLLPDSGEIWLDNTCLNKHKLDYYRASTIGYIFQDYNLIEYMNVEDNILLNGHHKKSLDTLLKQLGIQDKKKTVVSKLSGGEKQRVAIARALINNPDIILADEPTGALDSKNSIEVLEILKRISEKKLVIVVSHDINLANKYADRIINIKDGKCDYKPIINDNRVNNEIKKTCVKYHSILKLAIKNLWLKKGRTIFTSLAISLGIISTFIVLNISNNFSREINILEKDLVSIFPIIIENNKYEVLDEEVIKSDKMIILKDHNKSFHTNNINEKYLNYLNNISEIKYLIYDYNISLPLISDKYHLINNKYIKSIPSNTYIKDNYNIIYGRNIENINEVLLKVDINNNVDSELLSYFNIDENIPYDRITGRKIKIILNNDYYLKNGEYYIINNNNQSLYHNSQIELTIVGIIKEKEETNNNNYIYYNNKLIEYIIDNNKNSHIVIDQLNSNYNVLGTNNPKEELLSFLGYNCLPSSISIYTDNLDNKNKVIKALDKYNDKESNPLIYTDTMNDNIDIVKKFISIISIILIAFSLIAIITSSIMIGILTNIRVLERRKEIGILRSIGASKKNIRALFNIENVILGLLSSLISYIIIIIIKEPINNIINESLAIDNIFIINYPLMFVVFILNILIVKISGLIPSRRASKMDIVKCIYNR